MEIQQRLIRLMRDLGIYQMKEDNPAVAELSIYGKQLDKFQKAAEDLIRCCFLDEVDSPYGKYFERLFHLEETTYPLQQGGKEQREAKIQCMKKRLSVKNSNFCKADIIEQISSYGMIADITENIIKKTITVTVTEDRELMSDYMEKEELIRNCMPCTATTTVQF